MTPVLMGELRKGGKCFFFFLSFFVETSDFFFSSIVKKMIDSEKMCSGVKRNF